MPPEQQTPLVLTAMTLRGIGSYMRGARLDVRPLTVLCGKNGSGKLTWLKVLNLLRRSVDANTLPWSFHVADRTIDSLQVTNAFYYLGFGGLVHVHSLLADPEADREFGPPGTIGLEFRASRDIELESMEDGRHERCGVAQDFLWSGKCPAGTAMKLRIAHPTFIDDSTPTPELLDWVELELDGGFVVRISGEREPLKDCPKPRSRPQRSKPYEVCCSEAFLRGRDPSRIDVVALATVTDLQILRCNSRRSNVLADWRRRSSDNWSGVFGSFSVSFSTGISTSAPSGNHTPTCRWKDSKSAKRRSTPS